MAGLLYYPVKISLNPAVSRDYGRGTVQELEVILSF
jgi:hypothetical protein